MTINRFEPYEPSTTLLVCDKCGEDEINRAGDDLLPMWIDHNDDSCLCEKCKIKEEVE